MTLTAIRPGASSALRHWHSHEDEFVYVLEVGDRNARDDVVYPDDDLVARASPRGRRFTRRDGTPY
ncbi:MAG: hypothetical protein IT529_16440 [Burkholderiales bacterium]|nr:hypothetical protein [Burkholderiales bacterium]